VEDNDEDEDTQPRKKEPRMKTNKVWWFDIYIFTILTMVRQRKAENYYSNANIKNKNRQQSALLKSLPVGKKGDRRKHGKS
jgi:nuclear GTP-binding protein